MFQLIYEFFGSDDSILRIFKYVTFRALMAGLTSMFLSFYLGKRMIQYLHTLKFKENIRIEGPESHSVKSGTPTMGGLMIITTLIISILLWGNLQNPNIILLSVFSVLFAMLGFRDDYEKAILKIKGGMKSRVKFLISVVLGLLFCFLFYYVTGLTPHKESKGIPYLITDVFLPFLKEPVFSLGIFAIPFSLIVIIGSSHAVNLTDGLDGLATGTVMIATITLGIISYVSGTPVAANYLNIPYLPGSHEYSIFLSALTGSLLGFLWFNSYPAEVFMGDTGSLFLGATLGMVSIMLKKEILLVILGGVFVAEAISVILQVASFKLYKKRIFRMAPLHHHFELAGLKETKIVSRFYIVAVILAIIALSSLKIQ
ncbi:MAG: phospho-N-acetylmuramoyl-pentapeptide-transferase [Leptospiraceae bacterium]|nr:phospho-N-acetylmuramoyl-pentapeptide-transferase [Leptospiraceae bacterium]MCP5497348.1 phospho-N-acetylmuramoyl-pentapeptide-transferase [Leptospiraceae bacterium]